MPEKQVPPTLERDEPRSPNAAGCRLAHYLLVVAATAGVSSICYRFIERPGIAAGRRLIDRLESPQRAA